MKKPQLYLLHFAGGSIYSFEFLKPYLPEFEFIPLELPGRGKRIRESFIRDLDEAAMDIYRQVEKNLKGQRFLLYGHSMGSTLALKVAGLLEKRKASPLSIIVSGNAGPGVYDPKKRYLMDNSAFKAELRLIGGMPEEVLQNEELLDFFEPLLKADFEIVEKEAFPIIPPITAPIYAIMGTDEEHTSQIENWSNYTSSDFEYELLEGNHFFIYKYPAKLADIIKSRYEKYIFTPPAQ